MRKPQDPDDAMPQDWTARDGNANRRNTDDQNAGDGEPDHWNAEDWDSEDRAILAALQSVDVPASAQARLRERLVAWIPGHVEEMEYLAELPAASSLQLSSLPGMSGAAEARGLTASRRVGRRLILALTVAAAIVGIAVFALRSQSLGRGHLLAHCSQQLDRILDGSPQWEPAAVQQVVAELKPLVESFRGMKLIGVKSQPAGGIAKSCRVWKFLTRDNKSLYVFEFLSPHRFPDIHERLSLLQPASGGWSLAAMQSADRLLVVAVNGDIEDYFRREFA